MSQLPEQPFSMVVCLFHTKRWPLNPQLLPTPNWKDGWPERLISAMLSIWHLPVRREAVRLSLIRRDWQAAPGAFIGSEFDGEIYSWLMTATERDRTHGPLAGSALVIGKVESG